MIWKFKSVPSGYWSDKKHQLEFMTYLGEKLGFKNMDDWYLVRRSDFAEHGGIGLLNHYNDSHVKLIQNLYPNHNWEVSKFSNPSESYWADKKIQREFFDKLAKKFEIKEWEDWYQIKASDVVKNGGTTIVSIHGGSVFRALMNIYPEHPWLEVNKNWFSSPNPNKSQVRLFRVFKEILSDLFKDINAEFDVEKMAEDIHFNYIHPDLKFSTGKEIELDIFVPRI